MNEKQKLDGVIRKSLMKRVRGQEYIDNVLGPCADGLVEALVDAYEGIAASYTNEEFYRAQGKIQGLNQALDLVRQIAKQSNYGEQD